MGAGRGKLLLVLARVRLMRTVDELLAVVGDDLVLLLRVVHRLGLLLLVLVHLVSIGLLHLRLLYLRLLHLVSIRLLHLMPVHLLLLLLLLHLLQVTAREDRLEVLRLLRRKPLPRQVALHHLHGRELHVVLRVPAMAVRLRLPAVHLHAHLRLLTSVGSSQLRMSAIHLPVHHGVVELKRGAVLLRAPTRLLVLVVLWLVLWLMLLVGLLVLVLNMMLHRHRVRLSRVRLSRSGLGRSGDALRRRAGYGDRGADLRRNRRLRHSRWQGRGRRRNRRRRMAYSRGTPRRTRLRRCRR